MSPSSRPAAATAADVATPAERLSDVVVPTGYTVWSWKVRNGSSVCVGETIAMAALVDSTSCAPAMTERTTTTTTTEAPTYKRPQSRRGKKKGNSLLVEDVGTNSVATEEKKPSRTVATPSSLKAITSTANGIFRTVEQPIESTTSTGEDILIIGYIEECQHPTIIEGLCAVCGSKVEPKRSCDEASTNAKYGTTDYPESVTNGSVPRGMMSRMTVAGLNVSVSHAEGQRMVQQDTERLHKLRKLSLVLDLDHTLVHATADPRAEQYSHRFDVRNLILPVVVPMAAAMANHPQHVWFQRHFVKIRPYVKEFLMMAMEHYEIGVYTAGTREYAEQIAILLARHLVGAQHDQIELDRLRQQVMHLTMTLQRTKRASKSNSTGETKDTTESDPEHTNGLDHGTSSATEIARDVAATHEVKETKAKRKRVMFHDVSPSSAISDENLVANLQLELDTAERLESQALEMRQKLFGSRVVSRTEVGDLGRDVKSLKRIFPCGGSMAAVIDDREDVWANAEEMASTRRGEPPENLLLVRPYHWGSFLGFADVNNVSGVDLTGQAPNAESDLDDQLRWTADILKRLHFRYYSVSGTDRPTVPDVLSKMRREVLSGCHLVLSGLVPLDKQNVNNDKRPRPPFIRYAESMGATIESSVQKTTTHVVGNRDGTDKIVAARSIKGCYVVRASWLVECVWSLTRRDELTHLLGQPPPAGHNDKRANQVRTPGGSHVTATTVSMQLTSIEEEAVSTAQETASTTSSDDENDVDFADSLADELMNEEGKKEGGPSLYTQNDGESSRDSL